jgi:5-methylcytosine-specific restriction endonuclease McrA
LSRGGSHSYANLGVAHSSCNLSKNNRLMEELTEADIAWMRRLVALRRSGTDNGSRLPNTTEEDLPHGD